MAGSYVQRRRDLPVVISERYTTNQSPRACYSCVTLKIHCDQKSPCSACKKNTYGLTSYLVSCMCFRTQYKAGSRSAFRGLKGVLIEDEHLEGERSSVCSSEEQWKVYTDSDSKGMTLEIPVRVMRTETFTGRLISLVTGGRTFRSVELNYSLPEDAISIMDRKLLPWVVEHQTRHKCDKLEDAMHFFMLEYSRLPQAPYSGAVRTVLEFGCLYRIWNSDRSFSYTSQGSLYSSLPDSIRCTFRHIFLVRLNKLESEILKTHDELMLVGRTLKREARAEYFGIWLFLFSHVLLQREMIKSSAWQGMLCSVGEYDN
ncbi:hypothetical protein F4803DRAFT_538836 [Xylaria telfairii]|nr:hypothetical protein F4803DRAFT_538836 [Xylaria telfairii]